MHMFGIIHRLSHAVGAKTTRQIYVNHQPVTGGLMGTRGAQENGSGLFVFVLCVIKKKSLQEDEEKEEAPSKKPGFMAGYFYQPGNLRALSAALLDHHLNPRCAAPE